MSKLNRRNQILRWYNDGINICTMNRIISKKIRKECKQRKLKHMLARARGGIYKIQIGK